MMKPILFFPSIVLTATMSLPLDSLMAQQKQEIFLADPTIFVEGGTYYLTGTGGSGRTATGFTVLASQDLENWSPPAAAAEPTPMLLRQGQGAFGSEGFWAPQLLRDGDTYYLTYTANEQT